MPGNSLAEAVLFGLALQVDNHAVAAPKLNVVTVN
jgi:hypothetical protein